AEGADDRRRIAVSAAGSGVVRFALANRVVLQGVEGDVGFAPVPLSGLCEGGRLGAVVPGDVLLPGVVPGASVASAWSVGGAAALVGLAAQPRTVPGVTAGGRGA